MHRISGRIIRPFLYPVSGLIPDLDFRISGQLFPVAIIIHNFAIKKIQNWFYLLREKKVLWLKFRKENWHWFLCYCFFVFLMTLNVELNILPDIRYFIRPHRISGIRLLDFSGQTVSDVSLLIIWIKILYHGTGVSTAPVVTEIECTVAMKRLNFFSTGGLWIRIYFNPDPAF
jgi:hypothetical protein